MSNVKQFDLNTKMSNIKQFDVQHSMVHAILLNNDRSANFTHKNKRIRGGPFDTWGGYGFHHLFHFTLRTPC